MPVVRTDTTPYKNHFEFYLAGFVVALLVFALTAYIARKGQATGLEYIWFTAINGWSESWYRSMTLVTMLGSLWMAVASVAVAFVVRMYRLAWRLAFSLLSAYGLVMLTKHLVERARPAELFDQVHIRMSETTMGFPSGHAAIATVIALTLLPYVPRKWWWVLPILVIAVALSRLYLGVHLPLDVIGGMALGTLVVTFFRLLPLGLRKRLRIA